MAGSAALVRLRFDRFELQLDERRLLADGRPALVRGHAFDLLAALAERPGHLITKAELLQRVWGKVVVDDNALQAQISALRKVLGAAAIATVPGQGYRFALDVYPVPAAEDAARASQHNLPQPLTSFIGREREISQIQQRLISHRLLTLTGAGGIGKSRLALEVAKAAVASCPGGVWLVELAPLSDPTLLVQAVARALSVEPKPGEAIEAVVLDWLRSRRTMLVLDNAEHLIEACAWLVERFLRQCPGLTVMVTSRERLGVDGEATYRVPSLSVPAGRAGEDLLSSEATRLLIDRARLLQPEFEVKGDDLATLALVCQRLDGIALAIELAAAQIPMMSLAALSRRLDDRFRVLGSGPRAAMPRHRTLRALIDWSHDLLSGAEKAMLRRVSVFAGGWTLEAAERVCVGDVVDSDQVLALLSALTDKSLVIAEAGAEQTRFDMLETVRHYAQDRLVEAREREVVHERHLRWLIGMAAGLESTNDDADVRQTMNLLQAEHDNLRAALARCEGEPNVTLDGLQLAAQLNWFWCICGHYAEGRSWLQRLLAKVAPGERGEAIAAALHTSGAISYLDHDPVAGTAHLQEAVVLWRELGNQRQLARSIGALADSEHDRGDFPAALAHYAEALSIARELGDARSMTIALLGLGAVELTLGDYAAAQSLLQQAMPVSRTVGLWQESYVRQVLGSILHAQGDLAGAESLLLEAAEKQRNFGDLTNASYAHLLVARVYQDMKRLPAAREHLQMAFSQQPQAIRDQLDWLAAYAGLMSDLAEPHCAVRLWGCLERHDESTPSSWRIWNRTREQALQQSLRRALGDGAEFDKAWEEGRSWSLDEAFEYARSLI